MYLCREEKEGWDKRTPCACHVLSMFCHTQSKTHRSHTQSGRTTAVTQVPSSRREHTAGKAVCFNQVQCLLGVFSLDILPFSSSSYSRAFHIKSHWNFKSVSSPSYSGRYYLRAEGRGHVQFRDLSLWELNQSQKQIKRAWWWLTFSPIAHWLASSAAFDVHRPSSSFLGDSVPSPLFWLCYCWDVTL